MKVKQALNTLITIATLGTAIGAGSLMGFTRAQADEEEFRVRRGFEIAPVPLNLRGKDRELVGLGSYLVNAVASCNMCHSAGTATEYTASGNPYFKGNEPTIVNQATYLGGGRVFASQVAGATPAIVSRNLTPDKTGRPVGGVHSKNFALSCKQALTWIMFIRTALIRRLPPAAPVFQLTIPSMGTNCRSCLGRNFITCQSTIYVRFMSTWAPYRVSRAPPVAYCTTTAREGVGNLRGKERGCAPRLLPPTRKRSPDTAPSHELRGPSTMFASVRTRTMKCCTSFGVTTTFLPSW